jgi:hypothetical protein
MPIVSDNIYTLDKAQVKKLIKRHGKQLSGTISNEKLVYIVLPKDVADSVDIQDILGNSLGHITVKEAWAL